jgi:hypothetical protein
MNVLILTPDRVGSTLLQRLLTIYMLRKEFNKPVINLHELTNGLIEYYNETMNQLVLGKPEGTKWGYFQSLDEIVNLLKSATHYSTSRLAHYHIVNRKDSVADQIKFYEYLNENFFIISCRRENLLEHALSWIIQAHSKKLNVYSINEKVNVFADIYQDGIVATQESLIKYLNKYKSYIEWSDTYFNIQSYFNYDTDVHNIEEYILNLTFMKNATNNTWKDMFGQDFKSWNTCHRMLPNLVLSNDTKEDTVPVKFLTDQMKTKTWSQIKGPDWPDTVDDYVKNKEQYPLVIQEEIAKIFNERTIQVTKQEHSFLEKNLNTYVSSNNQILKLVDDGFLVTGVPIKLQSLKEKKLVIKNFNQCIDWYNEWVKQNNFGNLYTEIELEKTIIDEEEKLNLPIAQQNLLQ